MATTVNYNFFFSKEVVWEIFSHFESPEQICKVQKVCKFFLENSRVSLIWKPLCQKFFPASRWLFDDLQAIQAQFSHCAENVEGKIKIDYQNLFKSIVIQNTKKKIQLVHDILSVPEILKSNGTNTRIIDQVKTEMNDFLKKIQRKPLFQQEGFFRKEASLIFQLLLNSCCVEDSKNISTSKKIRNYPKLLILLFDFFDSDFNFSPETFLDAWIKDKGLRPLEFTPDASCYFLKAYFLYSILRVKDLTPFVAALKRNFEFIEPIEMVTHIKREELSSQVADLKESEFDVEVHAIIFNQFCGLKGFVQGLYFSHLCQCKGINVNLFSGPAKLTPIFHYFLEYAFSMNNRSNDLFNENHRRTIANTFATYFDKDAGALLKKYHFTISGQYETQADLLEDLKMLITIPSLHLKLKDAEGRTVDQYLETLPPSDFKKIIDDAFGRKNLGLN